MKCWLKGGRCDWLPRVPSGFQAAGLVLPGCQAVERSCHVKLIWIFATAFVNLSGHSTIATSLSHQTGSFPSMNHATGHPTPSFPLLPLPTLADSRRISFRKHLFSRKTDSISLKRFSELLIISIFSTCSVSLA